MSKVSENTAKTSTIAVLRKTEFLGKTLTVFGTVATPLFLAKEVSELLEHTNSRMMLQSVDNDEKVVNNVYTLGGKQNCWFLTEYGLYEVLMQSRKPIAKEFKKGVKAILKEIRQQGYYATSEVKNNVNSDYVESLMDLIQFKDSQIEFKDSLIAFKDNLIDTLNNRVDHLLTLLEKYYHPEKQTKQPSAPAANTRRIVKHDAINIQRSLEVSGRQIMEFTDGERTYYLAQDIADLLGFVSSINMLHSHVKETNRQRFRNPCRLRSTTWFITEGGIYDLWEHYQYADPYRTRLMGILAALHNK
ncbi:MAG: hypothetical protein IKP73_12835 [Bacteroidales bacterium]|nr:hypothetical protein [Bacteroidales bacterium]